MKLNFQKCSFLFDCSMRRMSHSYPTLFLLDVTFPENVFSLPWRFQWNDCADLQCYVRRVTFMAIAGVQGSLSTRTTHDYPMGVMCPVGTTLLASLSASLKVFTTVSFGKHHQRAVTSKKCLRYGKTWPFIVAFLRASVLALKFSRGTLIFFKKNFIYLF